MAEEAEHFRFIGGWDEAEDMLGFRLLRPPAPPIAFWIHVRDHRLREVPPTLEVYFDGFVLSQALRDEDEARRLASQAYGLDPEEVEVAGHSAFRYELGPIPDRDDVDPRPPAVVAWADGPVFVMLASEELPSSRLLEIAVALYG